MVEISSPRVVYGILNRANVDYTLLLLNINNK